jgi:hypothetical protein
MCPERGISTVAPIPNTIRPAMAAAASCTRSPRGLVDNSMGGSKGDGSASPSISDGGRLLRSLHQASISER